MTSLRWTLCSAILAVGTMLPGIAAPGLEAEDVPVPEKCTKEVNAHLSALMRKRPKEKTDNVMVCGETVGNSHRQKSRKHGDHQIIPVLATMPDGSKRPIEVVTNDELDGKVTAKKGDTVFAYGQVFFDNVHDYAAGIHDVHCSTHKGANNGWVVVNGVKSPTSCPI
jgi:hypothetical protein